MKIKNLFVLGAFLTMSGGVMAQTTITAGSAKLVSDNIASLTYYYTNTEIMGGFQTVVSLPEGVTLDEDAKKTEKGLSINGGEVTNSAVFYNVSVPSGFECIGVKADDDGTTSDGTAYKAGDVLLACFPVKAGVEYKATSTPLELFTLKLTISNVEVKDNLKKVAINGFGGCDTKGTGGTDAAAKYVASAESKVSPVKALKEGDVNGDEEVNVADVDSVIEAIGEAYFKNESADINADSEINVADVDFVIERIV